MLGAGDVVVLGHEEVSVKTVFHQGSFHAVQKKFRCAFASESDYAAPKFLCAVEELRDSFSPLVECQSVDFRHEYSACVVTVRQELFKK